METQLWIAARAVLPRLLYILFLDHILQRQLNQDETVSLK